MLQTGVRSSVSDRDHVAGKTGARGAEEPYEADDGITATSALAANRHRAGINPVRATAAKAITAHRPPSTVNQGSV